MDNPIAPRATPPSSIKNPSANRVKSTTGPGINLPKSGSQPKSLTTTR